MFDVIELEELAGKVAGVDERLVADNDLLAGVESLEVARRLLEAVEGAFLSELDARGTTEIVHGMRTGQWLARSSGCSPAAAKARVRLALSLRIRLAGTEAAVREGRLCSDRAKVMAGVWNERIAAELGELEDELISMSENMTFNSWARHVALVADLLDQDGPEPADDVNNNSLNFRTGGDGTSVSGRLVGDLSLATRQAIEQVADELYRQYVADRDATNGEVEVPGRATLRALALGELCRRGLMVNADGGATRPKVEASLVINTGTPESAFNADGAFDPEAWFAQADVFEPDGTRFGHRHDHSGDDLHGSPGGSALTCDMSVWAVVLNSLGVPLDMGREIRSANREQRRAMAARDGWCIFPGCGAQPQQCDAHHVAHWWRDLGSTNVATMAFFCRHHHGVIHRKGWSVKIGDDGWAWITSPDRVRMWCQRHGVTRSGAPPPGGP